MASSTETFNPAAGASLLRDDDDDDDGLDAATGSTRDSHQHHPPRSTTANVHASNVDLDAAHRRQSSATSHHNLRLSTAGGMLPSQAAMAAAAGNSASGVGGLRNSSLSLLRLSMTKLDQREGGATTAADADLAAGSRPSPLGLSTETGESTTTTTMTAAPLLGTEPGAEREKLLWRSRRKHVFIFTSAGKPVFTRYGDEGDFSELFGIMQVLVSMAGSNRDQTLQYVDLGSHVMYFYTAGELTYVMVTATGEVAQSCMRQLQLMHLLVRSALPTINDLLKEHPGYDVRGLFGTSDVSVLRSLIKRLNNDPSYTMLDIRGEGCVRVSHLNDGVRKQVVTALLQLRCDASQATQLDGQGNEAAAGAEEEGSGGEHLYTMLFCREKLVAGISPVGDPLHPQDLLVLLNFVHCVTRQGSDSWAPLCLPLFNDTGYLWLHCRICDAESGCILVQLFTSHGFMVAAPANANAIQKILSRTLAAPSSPAGQRPHSATTTPPAATTAAAATLLKAVIEGASVDFEVPTDLRQRYGIVHATYCHQVKGQLLIAPFPEHVIGSKHMRKAWLRRLVQLKEEALALSRVPRPFLMHGNDEALHVVELAAGDNATLTVSFLPTVRKMDVPDALHAVRRSIGDVLKDFFVPPNMCVWPE